jgi:UDP-N-acetylglucosamine 3-dehydrogenase
MRSGLVGLGSMGQKHYRVMANSELVDLVAVVDCDQKSLEGSSVNFYTDVDQMLNKEKLDFVVVATPTSTHSAIATKVLSRGFNLFVEKPIAHNVDEAKRMHSLSEKNNCLAAVGHIERFNPAIQAILPELEGQNILHCATTRMSPYPGRIMDVGVKLDLGIHDMDLVRLLTQKQISSCTQASSNNVTDNEDTAAFMVKFEDGTCANMLTSWMLPFRERKIKILTETCYYEVDLLNLSAIKYESIDNSSYKTQPLYVKREDALDSQLSSFVNYIKTGHKGALCGLEDATLALSYLNQGG